VAEALKAPTDVLIDYTHPGAVKSHVLAAIEAGVAAVVGTSGLSAADYAEIDRAARKAGVGVIAAGNFSLTAALLLRFATMAAEHVPQWEVLDFASFTKPDAPSGTARELAERLGEVRKPRIGVAIEEMHGPKETRGADIAGTRVHSLRLPGFVIACEAVFGAESERLSIRHEAGASPAPYVAGTLLAARKVGQVTGLIRGLDRLLFD
jgi:4-hydroxy-tetrahydrodipicolinate reductase